jgi:hypothetical protein
MGPAPWQRARPHVTPCAVVFDFNENDSHPPPSLLTRPRPVIFSYSRKWNWSSKGDVLWALKRSRPNRWRCWLKMTSSSAIDHGNPTGIAGLTQNGTASKEMEANKHFDKWLSLGRRISGTFGQHPVYLGQWGRREEFSAEELVDGQWEPEERRERERRSSRSSRLKS